jgi:uncharacterized coiled-coil DUF342 family protein
MANEERIMELRNKLKQMMVEYNSSRDDYRLAWDKMKEASTKKIEMRDEMKKIREEIVTLKPKDK